jgi:hypothetical protein
MPERLTNREYLQELAQSEPWPLTHADCRTVSPGFNPLGSFAITFLISTPLCRSRNRIPYRRKIIAVKKTKTSFRGLSGTVLEVPPKTLQILARVLTLMANNRSFTCMLRKAVLRLHRKGWVRVFRLDICIPWDTISHAAQDYVGVSRLD